MESGDSLGDYRGHLEDGQDKSQEEQEKQQQPGPHSMKHQRPQDNIEQQQQDNKTQSGQHSMKHQPPQDNVEQQQENKIESGQHSMTHQPSQGNIEQQQDNKIQSGQHSMTHQPSQGNIEQQQQQDNKIQSGQHSMTHQPSQGNIEQQQQQDNKIQPGQHIMKHQPPQNNVEKQQQDSKMRSGQHSMTHQQPQDNIKQQQDSKMQSDHDSISSLVEVVEENDHKQNVAPDLGQGIVSDAGTVKLRFPQTDDGSDGDNNAETIFWDVVAVSKAEEEGEDAGQGVDVRRDGVCDGSDDGGMHDNLQVGNIMMPSQTPSGEDSSSHGVSTEEVVHMSDGGILDVSLVTPSDILIGPQGPAETTRDEEPLKQSGQPIDELRVVSQSHFPALDNVDLESDEEGQDGGEIEERGTIEGLRHISQDSSDRSNRAVAEITANVGTDCDGMTVDSHRDVLKEYPLNYQNYKVCREVSPGVKECLILETGEQYIYVSNSQSSADGSHGFDSKEVEVKSLIKADQEGSNFPHGVSTVVDTDSIQPSIIPPDASNDTDTYTSLEKTDQRFPDSRNLSLPADIHHKQIVRNEASNIVDNSMDDIQSESGQDTDNSPLEYRAPQTESGILEFRVLDKDRVMSQVVADGILHEDIDKVVSRKNVVEGIMKREAGRPYQSRADKEPSLRVSHKKRQERFFELQPDVLTSVTDDSDINTNNNSDQRGPGREVDTNENANPRSNTQRDQQRIDTSVRSSRYPSDRSYHTEGGAYDRYTSLSGSLNRTGSQGYSQSASRDSSYFDSRGQRSEENSLSYRSRDPSSIDSSQISTRYTRIERGDARNVAPRSESVTIPRFRTLHDQQVNWLEMFKVIEQQHRTELQSQYLEHQKILQDMQKNMEKELLKQQDTLKQRLLTHREMLEELSPGRPAAKNINQSWMRNEADSTVMSSSRSSENPTTNSTSHTTLQGIPVALRNPPPILRYQHTTREHKTADDLPVKRSLEKDLSSPVRPADMSLNLQSHVTIDRDKQLRGGVYSSPLPLAKVKQKRSPHGSKSYESTYNGTLAEETSHNTNSVHWGSDTRGVNGQQRGQGDMSLTESDEVLSPRTRSSLKEKHARHLADLQAYYEKELRALRETKGVGSVGGTAADKILASENQELRQKCQDLQEAYHDAKIEIRELQQKMQGLEIRATDYADRYSSAQSQVLTLKSRLEELTDYAREKESAATDLENKNRKCSESLQIAYKKEKELTDSLHNAKNTIQKLVDKYESLDKDHEILKESSAETQEKLYSSRAEVVEINNKMSRLELENKQLKHDMENLRRDLTMTQSSMAMHTSYEDAYHKSGTSDRARPKYRPTHTSRTQSTDRSHDSHSGERPRVRGDTSPESGSDNDFLQSPLIKAQRELEKMQKSQHMSPKLQRKFYGTEIPASYSGPPITVDRTSGLGSSSPHSIKSHSPRDKKALSSPHGAEFTSRSNAPTSSFFSRSQREGSRLVKDSERGPYQSFRDKNSNRNHVQTPKRSGNVTNGLTGDQAIERVKAGEIVSRPAWEDVYTSFASARPGARGQQGSPSNYTRDQIVRERIQNIENMEKKYDDLTNEKRKFEAALSKLPGQGHGRERDRLETELDRVDQELGSVRMSLKRYNVLKSTI